MYQQKYSASVLSNVAFEWVAAPLRRSQSTGEATTSGPPALGPLIDPEG